MTQSINSIDENFGKKRKQPQKRKAPPSDTSPVKQKMLLLLNDPCKGRVGVIEEMLYSEDIYLHATETDDEGYSALDLAVMLGIIKFSE